MCAPQITYAHFVMLLPKTSSFVRCREWMRIWSEKTHQQPYRQRCRNLIKWPVPDIMYLIINLFAAYLHTCACCCCCFFAIALDKYSMDENENSKCSFKLQFLLSKTDSAAFFSLSRFAHSCLVAYCAAERCTLILKLLLFTIGFNMSALCVHRAVCTAHMQWVGCTISYYFV